MTVEGFFRADGDRLVPAAFATSPWSQGPVGFVATAAVANPTMG